MFYKAYILSISIESVIIYKNISDVIEIKEKKVGLGFFEKLKLIIEAKKNPILLTILTENLITFSSTMIPLLCQIFYILKPSSVWGIGGGIIIGLIQMFCY